MVANQPTAYRGPLCTWPCTENLTSLGVSPVKVPRHVGDVIRGFMKPEE